MVKLSKFFDKNLMGINTEKGKLSIFALAIDENVIGVCFITKYKKGGWKKSFAKKIF